MQGCCDICEFSMDRLQHIAAVSRHRLQKLQYLLATESKDTEKIAKLTVLRDLKATMVFSSGVQVPIPNDRDTTELKLHYCPLCQVRVVCDLCVYRGFGKCTACSEESHLFKQALKFDEREIRV